MTADGTWSCECPAPEGQEVEAFEEDGVTPYPWPLRVHPPSVRRCEACGVAAPPGIRS